MATNIGETVFFHEDLCRQREILPAECLAFCLEQAALIRGTAADSDGRECVIRQVEPVALRSKNISLAELEKRLAGLRLKKKKVKTGYGGVCTEDCPCTVAFCADGGLEEAPAASGNGELPKAPLTLFCDFDEDRMITALWFDHWDGLDEERQNLFRQILKVIRQLGPFILADWFWLAVFDLDDDRHLDRIMELSGRLD